MNNNNPRDYFEDRIEKGLIGPGSDSWGLPDDIEIISDYPLIRYFSGILFPEKESANKDSKFPSFQDSVDNEMKADTEGDGNEDYADNKNVGLEEDELDSDIDSKKNINKDNVETPDSENLNSNRFHPNNMGLTFCAAKNTQSVKVSISLGIYEQKDENQVKIKATQHVFESFFDKNLPVKLSFADKLAFDGEYMYLTKRLEGYKGGRGHKRSGDYLQFDEFKHKSNLKDTSTYWTITYLEKLLGRTWQRTAIEKEIEIPLNDRELNQIEINITEKLKAILHVKILENKKEPNKKYVKLLLVNAVKHPQNEFSNKKEPLNVKCFFQTQIKIVTDRLLPYKTYSDLHPFDVESQELNLLYRDVSSYAIGHNCAVEWNLEENIISSTYTPKYDVKDVKNKFEKVDEQFSNSVYDTLEKCLNINNLSIFSDLSKEIVIQNLDIFVNLYSKWIESQLTESKKLDTKYQEPCKRILSRLENNRNRLIENISLLHNEQVFKAFQLANTAMLIQIIISSDDDFSKKEKELSEIKADTSYNDLDFFRNYKKIKPTYRPFQLAFLLLNLKGIINPESDCRQNIVDLIWFPTGGGKTEAYLAVAALTIIWRRMNDQNGDSEGVAVIMRYTLRLLTAQQFERASRLISSLEFLRQKHSTYIKGKPITIGLWIGNQSTPGTISSAKSYVKEIQTALISGNNKKAHEHANALQVAACPWCGTKTISKNLKAFKTDSLAEDSKSKHHQYFKIECLNQKCLFHKEMPVQVVDEMLFKEPPTLLFGTVDKFARLAWEEETHKFFNSLSDKALPPDLIIQDELHLLSGPLGSIVGLYETLIERLCTKGDRKPKIIASTATTRNTKQQVEQLYNRTVNVFPPSGINYDDSFFAKIATTSKRRYMGFMPAGKSALDTQLQLLSHLLVARLEAAKVNYENIDDNYWTIVSYYNTLREVGKVNNKISDEIKTGTSLIQHRLFRIFNESEENKWTFNYRRLVSATEELTSRILSHRIRETLKNIEENKATFEWKDFTDKKGIVRHYLVSDVMDLILATNMFSVGIDIKRLNIMLINGMPKNTAEYIQASSRVGREENGLVLTLLDPNRARDKSYFEHFMPFHQAFYKSIEPLSVTPFTENTIDKLLTTLLVAYVRNTIVGMSTNNQAQHFQSENIDGLKQLLKDRFGESSILDYAIHEVQKRADDWEEQAKNPNSPLKTYKDLLKDASKALNSEYGLWTAMNSLRDIDTNSFFQIIQPFIANVETERE